LEKLIMTNANRRGELYDKREGGKSFREGE